MADVFPPDPFPSARPGRPDAGPRPSGRAGEEPAELQAARVIARLMDDAVEIPGTGWRIGIDPLLGLVPGIGDLIGAFLSSWLLVAAHRLGAPPAVIARMGLNIAFDAVIGVVPLAGDLADAAWKANRRNLQLLEAWRAHPGKTRRSSGLLVAAIVAATLAAIAGLAWLAWSAVAAIAGLSAGG
jgi:hypothetical protein